MTAIVLQGFIGEQPRIVPRYLDQRAAQSAFNARLDDGALSPFRRSATIKSDAAGAEDWMALVLHGADWLGWDTFVHAVAGPVAEDRLYIMGDGAPKMRYLGIEYALAVPRPATALTTSKSGSGTGDVITRTYTYTWVSDLGEESEPAPASNAMDWQDGETITLAGFGATPPDRRITKQRIYRSQTGQVGTFFYLIAERNAATTGFDDTVAIDAFQEPLPATDYNAPPDDLEGLIALPNGMMAAFAGRKVYFCEPYQPHAWPEKYVLTTNAEIMGLGAVANSIIVMTAGQPHFIQGTAPESMQMTEIEQNLPCINKRSIVDLGYAIAYASHDGLVVVDASGSFRIATQNLFNRQEWEAHNPQTMVGAQLSGRYFAFYERVRASGQADKGALIIDVSGDGYLIRTDTRASAAWYDIAGSRLYYVDPDTGYIREFDAQNASRRSLYWRSKLFVLPRPENFAAILVDSESALSDQEVIAAEAEKQAISQANDALIADGPIGGGFNESMVNTIPLNGDNLEPIPDQTPDQAALTIYADGEVLHTTVRTGKAVRLPAGKTARKWEIDVSANVRIDRIAMANTVDELKALG